MGKRLYVGNLSYSVVGSGLQQLFAQFGQVASADVISDRVTGRAKGFGFVEMGSDEDAQKAIVGLNGTEYEGRKMVVNEARPREDRRNSDRGFERSSDRSSDRGSDRGSERGSDRSFRRNSDRNSDRGFRRNSDRDFDRGSDRY